MKDVVAAILLGLLSFAAVLPAIVGALAEDRPVAAELARSAGSVS